MDPVWLNYCIASSGLSMIVAEQPTAALSTSHLTAVAPKVWFRDDELVGETLMIAFVMVMGQALLERIVHKAFSQYNHLRESLLLDGAHKPLIVRVQIRTPRW